MPFFEIGLLDGGGYELKPKASMTYDYGRRRLSIKDHGDNEMHLLQRSVIQLGRGVIVGLAEPVGEGGFDLVGVN